MRVAAGIALLLAPLVCVWIFRSEIVLGSADLASCSLSIAAVLVLLLLLAARAIARRRSWRREIVLVYAVVTGTVGISTMGMVQFLVTTLATPAGYSGRYAALAAQIPAWAAPRDPEIVRGFFLGRSSLYEPAVWKAWLLPCALWSLCIGALLVAQWCLACVLYPRWAEHEKLTFPVVQLPLTLTDDGAPRSPALWIGLALALGVQGLNALHHAYPALPQLSVLPREIGPTLPLPWSAMGRFGITFYPAIIGLAALVPTRILFSCVAFFFALKAEQILAFQFGLRAADAASGFPYPGQQAQGALVGFALLQLWASRGRLAESLARRDERGYWVGFAAASAFLVGFGCALGLRLSTALTLFGLFFLLMTSIGWLRAAVGPIFNPGNDVGWWCYAGLGDSLTPANGVGIALLRWFSYGEFRAHALPTYAEALRAADAVGVPRRRLAVPLAAASALAIVASLWIALDTYYRFGATSASVFDRWRLYCGRVGFDILQSALSGLRPAPTAGEWQAVGCGALATALLQIAQTRLPGWPLPAAGFVLAQSGTLEWLWCPMLIALIVKASVLRFGGVRLYRQVMPGFVGLILGDWALSGVLAVLSGVVGVPLYKGFPVE